MEALQGACMAETKGRQLEATSLCGEPWPTPGSGYQGELERPCSAQRRDECGIRDCKDRALWWRSGPAWRGERRSASGRVRQGDRAWRDPRLKQG